MNSYYKELKRWRKRIVAFLSVAGVALLLAQLSSSSFALLTTHHEADAGQLRTAFVFPSVLEEELEEKRSRLQGLERAIFSQADFPNITTMDDVDTGERAISSLRVVVREAYLLQSGVDAMVERFHSYVERAEEEVELEDSRSAHRLLRNVRAAYESAQVIQNDVDQFVTRLERMALDFEEMLSLAIIRLEEEAKKAAELEQPPLEEQPPSEEPPAGELPPVEEPPEDEIPPEEEPPIEEPPVEEPPREEPPDELGSDPTPELGIEPVLPPPAEVQPPIINPIDEMTIDPKEDGQGDEEQIGEKPDDDNLFDEPKGNGDG